MMAEYSNRLTTQPSPCRPPGECYQAFKNQFMLFTTILSQSTLLIGEDFCQWPIIVDVHSFSQIKIVEVFSLESFLLENICILMSECCIIPRLAGIMTNILCPGFVMALQFRYQRAKMYRKVALGLKHHMSVSHGMPHLLCRPRYHTVCRPPLQRANWP